MVTVELPLIAFTMFTIELPLITATAKLCIPLIKVTVELTLMTVTQLLMNYLPVLTE